MRGTWPHGRYHRSEPLQRDRGCHGPLVVGAQIGEPFSLNISRQNGVDCNTVFAELDAGRAHEAELRGFAGSIMRPTGKAGDRPGDRRGQYDAATTRTFESWQGSLNRKMHPFHVGR